MARRKRRKSAKLSWDQLVLDNSEEKAERNKARELRATQIVLDPLAKDLPKSLRRTGYEIARALGYEHEGVWPFNTTVKMVN